MTIQNETVASKLRKMRKAQGLSFTYIAEMSGFSEMEIARFERYPLNTTPLQLKMLSKYWGSFGDTAYETMMMILYLYSWNKICHGLNRIEK